MAITKRDVDKLTLNTIIWDDGQSSVTGFGVRRQRSEIRTFILKYRTGSRSRWHTIGQFGQPWTVDTARNEARRLVGILAGGGELQPEASSTAAEGPLLIGPMCDQYLAAAKAGTIYTRFKKPKKSSTLQIDEGRINRHIKPLIGEVPVCEITRAKVSKMIADIAAGKTATVEKTGPRGRAVVTGGNTTAARVADLLSGIMAWAIDQGHIEHNPVHGVRRFRPDPRQRHLAKEELGRLGKVLRGGGEGMHPYAVAITELLCLTGCRLGEIANLQWSEIDDEAQCLRLGDTKTGRSVRPVGKAALDFLSARPRQVGSPFVFPALRGSGSYQGVKRVSRKIFEAAEIDGVSSHTLRHTFATVAAGLGYSDAIIGGLLGHASRGVTSRYVHRPDEAFIAAADAVSTKVAAWLVADDRDADGL